MNVHFINELDQKDLISKNNLKSMYKVNGELSSCDIIFWQSSMRGRFCINLLNGLSKSAQTFTVGFVNLLSNPFHIVFGETSPLKFGYFHYHIKKTHLIKIWIFLIWMFWNFLLVFYFLPVFVIDGCWPTRMQHPSDGAITLWATSQPRQVCWPVMVL